MITLLWQWRDSKYPWIWTPQKFQHFSKPGTKQLSEWAHFLHCALCTMCIMNNVHLWGSQCTVCALPTALCARIIQTVCCVTCVHWIQCNCPYSHSPDTLSLEMCCALCVYRVFTVHCVHRVITVHYVCTEYFGPRNTRCADIWECFPGFTSATVSTNQPAMEIRPEWKSAENGNHENMAFPQPAFSQRSCSHFWNNTSKTDIALWALSVWMGWISGWVMYRPPYGANEWNRQHFNELL